jgi:hypothetical protein
MAGKDNEYRVRDLELTRSSSDNVDVVSFRTRGPLDRDTEIACAFAISAVTHVLVPTYQGPIERRAPDRVQPVEFRGPGWVRSLSDGQRLAVPYLLFEHPGGFDLIGTDPSFSTIFEIREENGEHVVGLRWAYQAVAGEHDQERRLIRFTAATLHEAVERWFEYATPEVPRAPSWLRDVALQDYDYFSKNGDGWFSDIDAVTEFVRPEDRSRALFTLHGWYDTVGRYCFGEDHVLDDSWTVFPYMTDPEFRAREHVQQPENNLPHAYAFRNLANYRSLTLDWEEIRRRLSYARNRGLRTGFYLITGLMALGDKDECVSDGTGLPAESVLWIGPDAIGPTYLMNPLHPQVRDRILALTDALLEKVGDLVDAFVIDEAYYIGYGEHGPPSCPGYADQAQASLIREIAERCHAFRPTLALLTADHLGTQTLEPKAYPYSLFADGIYHDAWCHAQPWQASVLPTWRSVTWSCNWAPSSEILNTKWAVMAYDAPIALSNGCFGDDIGIADMPEVNRELIRQLWELKMSRRRDRVLPIVDVS